MFPSCFASAFRIDALGSVRSAPSFGVDGSLPMVTSTREQHLHDNHGAFLCVHDNVVYPVIKRVIICTLIRVYTVCVATPQHVHVLEDFTARFRDLLAVRSAFALPLRRAHFPDPVRNKGPGPRHG
jgi:hypothetical protein